MKQPVLGGENGPMAGLTRAGLWQLLGYPGGAEPGGRFEGDAGTGRDGVTVHRGVVAGPRGRLPALLLMPATVRGPAVLYAHAHGGRYDIGKAELLDGRPALLDPPLGLALASAGHPVLAMDMPGFGARTREGSEAALSKAALWQGRCLLGDMLADMAAGFAALREVAGGQVVTVGISMGGTLAYWFAALEPRVAGCAHMCVLADIAPLIAAGGHDRHGIYMTVPGLLRLGDMGDVAALVAPRPHVVGVGLQDPLTPAAALEPALERLRAAYAAHPGRLNVVISGDTGHVETPRMRRAVFGLLDHVA